MSSSRLLKPKLWTLRFGDPWFRSLRTFASMSALFVMSAPAVAEGAEVLLDDEADGHRVAQLPDLEVIAGGIDRLSVVLDDAEMMLVGDRLDGRHVRALSVEMCGMMALVFDVIAASILAGSMHLVLGSQSTNTAVAPAIQIASAVAKNVFGWVMTSSPGPMPSAISASQIESVPLPVPIANSRP
jgi:hypothetical protein